MAVLKANKRDEVGTRKARRLRQQGLVPAVIYGHGEETQSIALDEHDLQLAILRGGRLLEIDCDGRKENTLIKEVQYDTFGQHVLHVDLTRVDLDERVEVSVAIVLKGTPVGVTEESGVLQQTASEILVECPVRSIPESIEVLVTEMKVGDHLTMADLPMADDVKLLEDPEAPVAAIRVLAEEVEAEPEEAEAEAAQPEVIGEAKEQPEEDEESTKQ